VGDSLVQDEALDTARELLAEAGTKLRLPVDVVIAPEISDTAEKRVIPMGPVPMAGASWILAATIESYSKVIAGARTVVWNGPMGVFETAQSPKAPLLSPTQWRPAARPR
jgi:phosphoglycerate kinase